MTIIFTQTPIFIEVEGTGRLSLGPDQEAEVTVKVRRLE
jgi:hypothetical protein